MNYLVRNYTAGRLPKVHILSDAGVPLCGGGNGARAAQWQREIGPCNCRACKTILNRKSKTQTPPPVNPPSLADGLTETSKLMNTLIITSVESLETAVAEAVRLKIEHTKAVAFKEAEIAVIERTHQPNITALAEKVSAQEASIFAYCNAHRAALFVDKKSRETSSADFGFEFTPYRVETTGKKITFKDVVKRLKRLKPWGPAYIRKPDPQPDKNSLLADREKLTPDQQTAAGIQFCRDEQFFIRPKPQTAAATVREAA